MISTQHHRQAKAVAMGKVFSAYVKRPIKNWNVENRAQRFIEKAEKLPAPRHPSTAAAFEQLVAGMHTYLYTVLN